MLILLLFIQKVIEKINEHHSFKNIPTPTKLSYQLKLVECVIKNLMEGMLLPELVVLEEDVLQEQTTCFAT